MHRIEQLRKRLARPFTRQLAMAVAVSVALGAMASAQAADRGHDDKGYGGHHHGKKHSYHKRGPFLKAPLHLRDYGSFYIGGVPKVSDYHVTHDITTVMPPNIVKNQAHIGGMYVQFLVPLRVKKGAVPVINVHGSSHTGAALESTPHGTEGWMPYMARKGIPTYAVDQPGRGRSGFDNSIINEAKYLIGSGNVEDGLAMLPTVARIPDTRAWLAWFGHLYATNNPNDCTPTEDILTGYLSQHGGRTCDPGDTPGGFHPPNPGYMPTFPIKAREPARMPPNLLPIGNFPDAHLGPRPAGPEQYYDLEYYRQLVPNMEATLPGSRCETCKIDPLVPASLMPGFDPTALAPSNTWSPWNLALLVEELGKGIVATHSQSGIQGHHMVRHLRDRGSLKKLKALITVEGGCSFLQSGLNVEDFDDVAYLAIVGDYTPDSPTCMDSVAKINARRAQGLGTAKAEYIKLDDPKYGGRFNGVTHMMMLDKTNLKVADVILDWVNRNVKKDGKDGNHGHH